jgi:lipopolysaccharide export system permease protein
MNAAQGIFTLYVGRIFLVRFVGFLLFFAIIMQMLDLLNRSSDIMAADGATVESLIRYVRLRTPQIVAQFTPFAALLGIVITLAGLSHTSEITVMRAAGMSVYRVLLPVGFVCVLISVAHFIFFETVTIKSSDALDYWAANDYALNLPEDTGTRTNIRINFDNEYISAQSAARFGDAVLLSDVTIYDIDEHGLASKVIEARAARHEDGVWRLFGVKTFDAVNLAVTESAVALWTNSLNPELLFALTLKPDQTGLGDLSKKIRQLRREGADTREAMTSFLGRFSRPMATLVMPLLGAIAGFGMHRQGVLLVRAISGSALGFTYFVAESLALALGKLGVIPALLGAFGPLALFMIVGFSILLSMEN